MIGKKKKMKENITVENCSFCFFFVFFSLCNRSQIYLFEVGLYFANKIIRKTFLSQVKKIKSAVKKTK